MRRSSYKFRSLLLQSGDPTLSSKPGAPPRAFSPLPPPPTSHPLAPLTSPTGVRAFLRPGVRKLQGTSTSSVPPHRSDRGWSSWIMTDRGFRFYSCDVVVFPVKKRCSTAFAGFTKICLFHQETNISSVQCHAFRPFGKATDWVSISGAGAAGCPHILQ